MAFESLEIKVKAELKDLKKGFKESQKEVAKLKKDIEKMAGPLEKIGKTFQNNAKLATKLKNINASAIQVKRNNLKLSLDQIKAQEKALKMAGKLDDKTKKGLEERKRLLTDIANKEIAGIKEASKAATAMRNQKKADIEMAKRIATAKSKEMEMARNISVIAEKNRRLALQTAMVGANQVEKIRMQLAFDLKSLDIQRKKLTEAKKINRETIKGLNQQKNLLKTMAANKISLIEDAEAKKTTGFLAKAKSGFSKFALGVVAANQALELLSQGMRAFRFVFGATIQQFADFETAMIKVSKTTNLTDEELSEFSAVIKGLSNEIPVTSEELAKFAEVAGQLGVEGSDNLLNFAETMARVQVSTNLMGDQAAETFAQILNVTGTPIDRIDEFSSVIVKLGNEFETTEKKIVRMTNEVARATTDFDVAVEDTAAFAVAMNAMGIRAEIGGSVLARAMVKIEDALRDGGVELKNLNDILGENAEGFKETFETDATKATQIFLNSLNKLRIQGVPTIATLRGIGLQGDEVNKVLPPLVKNVDSLNEAFAFARAEMTNATELMRESEKQFATLNSRIQVMKNSFANLGVEIGAVFAPLVTMIVNGLATLAQTAASLVKSLSVLGDLFVALATKGKAFLVILGAIGTAMLGVSTATAIASAAFAKLAAALAFVGTVAVTAAGALVPLLIAGAKFVVIAVGVFGVVAALEVLAKNITNLVELFKFVELAVIRALNNVQIIFQQVVMKGSRLLRDFFGFLGKFHKGARDTANRFANDMEAAAKRTQKRIKFLDKQAAEIGQGLDFGFTGEVVSKTKDFIKLFSDATREQQKAAEAAGKVRKNIGAGAKTQEDINKELRERLQLLRLLSKIYKENGKLLLETMNIGKDSAQVELNNLQGALRAIDARTKLLELEGKINKSLGEKDPILQALNEQRRLTIEKTAKMLDEAIPDRVLKRLSVDVVFGSFEGFLQGMRQAFEIFDQATMGFFSVMPRIIIDAMDRAGSFVADWFAEGVEETKKELEIAGRAFEEDIMPILSSVGDFIADGFAVIDEALGNTLSEGASLISDVFMTSFEFLSDIFSDSIDTLANVFSESSEFISSLFPDDALAQETSIAMSQSDNLEAAIGSGMSAIEGFLSKPQTPLDKSATDLSNAAVQLEFAALALEGAKTKGPEGAVDDKVAKALGDAAVGAAASVAAEGAATAASAAGGVAAAAGGAGLAAAGPVGAGLAFADTIAGAIQGLIDFIPNLLNKIAKIFDTLTDLPQKIAEGIANVDKALIKFIRNFIPNIIRMVQEILQNLGEFARQLPNAIVEMMQEVPMLLVELFEAIPDVVKNVVQGLIETFPAMALAFIEFIIKGIPKIAVAFIQMIPEIINAFVDGIMAAVENIIQNIFNLLQGKALDFGGLEDAADNALKSIERAVTGVGEELFTVADIQAAAKAEKLTKDFTDAIRRAGFDVLKKLRELWLWVWGLLKKAWQLLEDAWKFVWEMLSKAWEALKMVWQAIFVALEALWHMLEVLWKNIISALQKTWEMLVMWVEKAWSFVINFFNNLWKVVSDAFKPVTDMFGNLTNIFREAVKPLTDLLNPNAIKDVFQKGLDLLNPMNLLSKMFKFESGGRGTVEKLVGIDVPFVNFSEGGAVPGVPRVFGNSDVNDTVPALLSPGEFVLPRSVTNDKNLMNLIQGLVQGTIQGFGFGGSVGAVLSGKESPGEAISGGLSGAGKALDSLGIGDLFKKYENEIRGQVAEGLRRMMAGTVARQGFQQGGIVGGFGSGDIVPAMLEPGEGVLNRGAVQRLGQQTIQNLNRGETVGDTNIEMNLKVETTQPIDDAFIRRKLMPAVKDELKRASSNNEFIMSKRGIR